MEEKALKGSIITTLLCIVLFSIIGVTIRDFCKYYGGAEYKVDCYIRYLNERAYHKIYGLLEPQVVQKLGGREAVGAYYEKIYAKENQLCKVEKRASKDSSYKLAYQYPKSTVIEELKVINDKGRYRVQFPFEERKVSVFAPLGSKVYLESRQLSYHVETRSYELEHVLPGNYMLKVDFSKAGYSNYFTILHIPENENFEVPYETGHVSILCAPNLDVSLEGFVKESNHASRVEYNDVLVEKYKVLVKDKAGYFLPQLSEVEVSSGENRFAFTQFKLSSLGEETLSQFIRDFYIQYVTAIKEHDSKLIESYFCGENKAEQTSVFSNWYIDKKDIKDVDMRLSIGKTWTDVDGKVHVIISEQAVLNNLEYDEINEEDIERNYQVLIDFEVEIDVLEAKWKVVNRQILQSMVAMQDSEGKWVQY